MIRLLAARWRWPRAAAPPRPSRGGTAAISASSSSARPARCWSSTEHEPAALGRVDGPRRPQSHASVVFSPRRAASPMSSAATAGSPRSTCYAARSPEPHRPGRQRHRRRHLRRRPAGRGLELRAGRRAGLRRRHPGAGRRHPHDDGLQGRRAWSTCPDGASSSRSDDAGEIWIADFDEPARARDHAASRRRQASPYDGMRHAGRPLLRRRPVRRGRAGAARSLGPEPRRRAASSPATATASSRCRSTRCRTSRAGPSAGERSFLPAVGRHEILVVRHAAAWQEVGRIPSRPAGFRRGPARTAGRSGSTSPIPTTTRVQVIDAADAARSCASSSPAPAVLHMEFTPRGEQVWVSVRDADRVDVYDTASFDQLARDPGATSPAGIFFTARAHRIGF